ncbi:unnamed protein product [Polarella glacialis]|uniref:Acyltransferase 3 domain-containing protein n=1 Tax=Polarella glacialis TaxID=89957 RepID=A0A813E0U3_POLGL|nr:unnamed protein product [Polarella glacialis]CAE8641752.1 unnamed protein product [Polarella glacialis]
MACGLCSSVTSFSTTAAIQWHRSSSVSFSRRLSRPCIIFVPIMGFVNFWVNKQDRISLGAACTDLARRLDRLCPGYYLALLWLYAFGAYQYDPLAYQLQALFLQTLLPIRVCGLVYDSYAWHGANSDGWFVSAAVVCAVCFPMLYNARPRRGWQATAMVLLAVLTFCASTRWMRSHIDLYMEGLNIYVWAPPRVLEFFAGMFFAQLADELPEHLKSWPGWPCISDLCLGMAFVVVATSDSAMPTLAEDWFLTPLFGLHALSCSLTECSLARPDESGHFQRGCLDTLLSSHLLVDAAQYSFGAYILQQPVRLSITYLLQCLGSGPTAASWIMQLVSCWTAGMALTKFVENPVARVMSSRLKARA